MLHVSSFSVIITALSKCGISELKMSVQAHSEPRC